MCVVCVAWLQFSAEIGTHAYPGWMIVLGLICTGPLGFEFHLQISTPLWRGDRCRTAGAGAVSKVQAWTRKTQY